QPDGPISVTNSPRSGASSIANETSEMAVNSPNRTVTLRNSTTGSVTGRSHRERSPAEPARSPAAPAVGEDQVAQTTPGKIGQPGDQRNDHDRQVDMPARAASAGDFDDVAEAARQHDDLGQYQVAPSHAERETHRLPDLGRRDRYEDAADSLPAPRAERRGCAQVDIRDRLD